MATAFGEIYQYLVEGDTADVMERKTIHDWDLRTQLRSVSGVSEINSWGGLTRQYQVVVDPARLERFGVTLHEVFAAIAANNTSFSGGFIEHRSERYTVRGTGLVHERRRPPAHRRGRGRRRAGARVGRGRRAHRRHAAPGRGDARRHGRVASPAW